MNIRLPPLNALRAFEVAGRHLSLTRAAEELHVTPAAVSHQIKSLEDHLGVKLFRRMNRALLLTDAGQACLPGLRDGFQRLAEAVEAARLQTAKRALTVSVAPSFGAKWLVPRLDHFYAEHPGTDVRVDASTRLADPLREDIDLCIRYGQGDYPGLHVECLMADEVIPVCSPELLMGPETLKSPADLRHQTLLHADLPFKDGYPDWRMWLAAAGLEDVDVDRGPRFTMASMAVQAAIAGQGVALAGSVLVADDIAAGRLVNPFELRFPVKFAYYVVCPEATVNQPRIVVFRNWLKAEAKRSSRLERVA
jgi:LysR family glycine cleavage system transcriptional activator